MSKEKFLTDYSELMLDWDQTLNDGIDPFRGRDGRCRRIVDRARLVGDLHIARIGRAQLVGVLRVGLGAVVGPTVILQVVDGKGRAAGSEHYGAVTVLLSGDRRGAVIDLESISVKLPVAVEDLSRDLEHTCAVGIEFHIAHVVARDIVVLISSKGDSAGGHLDDIPFADVRVLLLRSAAGKEAEGETDDCRDDE